jgi:hypothetical protein
MNADGSRMIKDLWHHITRWRQERNWKLGNTSVKNIQDWGSWWTSDYLGIKIERKSDGAQIWTQLSLFQSILKDLRFDGEDQPKVRTVPASSTVQFTDHKDSPDCNLMNIITDMR